MRKRQRWWRMSALNMLLWLALFVFLLGNFYLVYLTMCQLWERFISTTTPAAATNHPSHPADQQEQRVVVVTKSDLSSRIKWRAAAASSSTTSNGGGHHQSHPHRNRQHHHHSHHRKVQLNSRREEKGNSKDGDQARKVIRVFVQEDIPQQETTTANNQKKFAESIKRKTAADVDSNYKGDPSNYDSGGKKHHDPSSTPPPSPSAIPRNLPRIRVTSADVERQKWWNQKPISHRSGSSSMETHAEPTSALPRIHNYHAKISSVEIGGGGGGSDHRGPPPLPSTKPSIINASATAKMLVVVVPSVQTKITTDFSKKVPRLESDFLSTTTEGTVTSAPPASAEVEKDGLLSSTTLTMVTALLDIGRERWSHYGRLHSTYEAFMAHVLRLRVPAVIFVDQRSLDFVRTVRSVAGLSAHTRVILTTLDQLPLYAHGEAMAGLMEHELHGGGWRDSEWDSSLRTHPESCQWRYDVLVNSKSYFLYNASVTNPFGTHRFAWLDAGYGHGQLRHFPAGYRWMPREETMPNGRISLIKVTPAWDLIGRYSIHNIYRRNVAVLSGGFIVGDSSTIQRFHHVFERRVVELLEGEQVVDDDQTVLVVLANEHPQLFHLVEGDWFDAFRLF